MKSIAVTRPAAPAGRLATVVVTIAVCLSVAAGAYLAGFQFAVAPSATPSPTPLASSTATAVPTSSAVGRRIDGYREAWHSGNTSLIESYLSDDTAIWVLTPEGGPSPDRFRITDEQHGWETWERNGPFISGGAYWAHPTWLGSFTGWRGFAVYRLAPDDRISVTWLLLRGAGQQGHEVAAPPAEPGIVQLLDDCTGAMNARDVEAFMACYAPDARSYTSVDGESGAWTESQSGRAAIGEALASLGPGDVLTRTDGILQYKDFAIYPFETTRPGCRAGIDAFELTPDHAQIVTRWGFCGP